MNNFERIKSLSIDELAKWLDENSKVDDTPWFDWWDENYCSKCEAIKCMYCEETIDKLGFTPLFPDRTIECTYCELENKCKYFPELDDVPDSEQIIKMWLEKNCEA